MANTQPNELWLIGKVRVEARAVEWDPSNAQCNVLLREHFEYVQCLRLSLSNEFDAIDADNLISWIRKYTRSALLTNISIYSIPRQY